MFDKKCVLVYFTGMPRLARVDIGDETYHVINRANGRFKIFNTDKDYQLFEDLLREAKELTGMRIYGYILMPNHWHLILSPKNDGDLALFMHHLCNTHTRRVHTLTKTVGSGHLYQGRYKSFLVQSNSYLLALIKYVERNPVRARLVKKCEDWRWGSAWLRTQGTKKQKALLTEPPVALPRQYLSWINSEDKLEDLEHIRTSVNKGVPYGKETWVEVMVTKHHLETTQRKVGRPKNIRT